MNANFILTRALHLMSGDEYLDGKNCKDLYFCFTFLLEDFQQMASEIGDNDNASNFWDLLCYFENQYRDMPDVISKNYEYEFRKHVKSIFEQIPEKYFMYFMNSKSIVNN